MLKKLTLEDYALVERIEIDFGSGLTVLTGETGAGKSVILNGLLLALGARADRDHIRHGAHKAVVKAVFDLTSIPHVREKVASDFEITCGPELRLGREITARGTSSVTINESATSAAKIRDLVPSLADFHSQQGHRTLLDTAHHIHFLDDFAGLGGRTERLSILYGDFISLAKQLWEATNDAAAMREKLELIRFQIDELEKAALRAGEEQELENERRRLESVRTLMEAGQNALSAVSESDGSVLSVLAQLERQLRLAAQLDERLKTEADLLDETVVNLNELTRNLESYLSRLEDNPDRLEYINARLTDLYRLKKKYGTDETGLLAKRETLKDQSDGVGDVESLIRNLSHKLTAARTAYLELALEISQKRKAEAPRLEKRVERELADLAIAKARFKIDFQTECDEAGFDVGGQKVAASPDGLEQVEFLISTNPNEPLKPLVKIASGGELSRIMLALLSVTAGRYHLPTIIFDEIDTGIGGVTAVKLASKLKELSKKHQVIVISHLLPVAQAADHHLAVSKTLKHDRNIISIKEIKGGALKEELSRMNGRNSRSDR